MVQGVLGEAAHQPFFRLAQRRRPETVAVTARDDRLGTPALDQYESGQHAASRPNLDRPFLDPPVECCAMSQHGVDMAGDVRTVLGADIAPAPEVIGGDIVGWLLAGVDRDENVGRGSDLCAWCQTA